MGLFSPAGIAGEASLARGIERLLDWGLEVCRPDEGPTVRFLAASDRRRAETVNGLLADATVDALMAIRGGYGCARILGLVDWELLRSRRIPLIGYSDLTAFHLAAYAAGCTHTVCGPMAGSTLGRSVESDVDTIAFARTLESLAFVLSEHSGPCHGGALRTLIPGRCAGPVVPANLAVMTSLIGTPFMPDLKGAILVLEDVNEAAYRVDRCLEQLDSALGLDTMGGLVFGQFTDGEDAEWLPEIFADFAARCRGPVCSGLSFGHGFPSISLPVGRQGVLAAAEHGGRLRLKGSTGVSGYYGSAHGGHPDA